MFHEALKNFHSWGSDGEHDLTHPPFVVTPGEPSLKFESK
jgi:hypothetical protein